MTKIPAHISTVEALADVFYPYGIISEIQIFKDRTQITPGLEEIIDKVDPRQNAMPAGNLQLYLVVKPLLETKNNRFYFRKVGFANKPLSKLVNSEMGQFAKSQIVKRVTSKMTHFDTHGTSILSLINPFIEVTRFQSDLSFEMTHFSTDPFLNRSISKWQNFRTYRFFEVESIFFCI